MIGGILVGIAWPLNTMLYLSAAIGGIGAGAVYGTCIDNALKWFPDRRGLAAGLTRFRRRIRSDHHPDPRLPPGSGY